MIAIILGIIVSTVFSLCVFAVGEENQTQENLPVFQQSALTVELSSDKMGSVSVLADGTAMNGLSLSLNNGTQVVLKATPSAGYIFDRWEVISGVDAADYSKPKLSFVIKEKTVIRAVFKETPVFSLSIEPDISGESFIPSAKKTYHQGEEVKIEAHPYDGFRFVEWMETAATLTLTDEQKKNPKLTFTMPGEDVVFTMKFEPITYYFTVKVQGNGEVELEGKTKNSAGKYECHVGEEIVIRATAGEEHSFVAWTGLNGPEFSDYEQSETTLLCPASDFTITANFASSVKTVTLAATEGGSTLPEVGPMRFGIENILDITAIPQAGFSFSHWECSSAAGKFGNEKEKTTTFTMPDEDCTVTAVFVKGSYRLVLASSAGGKAEGKEGGYEMGAKIAIKATPLEGYVFSRWECTSSQAILDPESAETEVLIPGTDVKVTAVFVLKTTVENQDPTPTPGSDGSSFPWIALVVIFLLSAIAIALVIIKEQFHLSYGYLIKKAFSNLFSKKG